VPHFGYNAEVSKTITVQVRYADGQLFPVKEVPIHLLRDAFGNHYALLAPIINFIKSNSNARLDDG